MTFPTLVRSVTLRPRAKDSLALVALLASLSWLLSCATGAGHGERGRVGYLRFEVEPSGAEVEIDEQYSGVIDRWVAGAVPVQPGHRRVTVRADGYITQRFDIEVGAGEEVTLELRLEPELEIDDAEEEEAPHRTRLRTLSNERRGAP